MEKEKKCKTRKNMKTHHEKFCRNKFTRCKKGNEKNLELRQKAFTRLESKFVVFFFFFFKNTINECNKESNKAHISMLTIMS